MKSIADGAGAGIRVPATLWTGTDVRQLANAELPDHWVLKPNHRSGVVYFGHGPPDLDELQKVTVNWLDDVQSRRWGEWAYSQARPLLLVEERIGRSETAPEDYKFFCFDAEVAVIQVDIGRFAEHSRRFYEPDWTPLETSNRWPLGPTIPKPPHLDQMLHAASAIATGFDHIRVDLYDTPDGVFFGEITPYPCGGLERFIPSDLDVQLGKRWSLPI